MAHETPTQPKLASLLTRFLNERAQAQMEGLAGHDPVADAPSAEVTPYDAGPVQPIDAKLAWHEALAAVPYFPQNIEVKKWPVPPDWASLVAGHEPVAALAFCVGNFPQLVRSLHLMLQNSRHAGVPLGTGPAMNVPMLVEWTEQVASKKQFPQMLLALASLRLARNFDRADGFVTSNDGFISQEWRPAWDNEKAALAWHQGRADAARALWNTMEPSVPVLFNRGMADIFGGDAARGRATLDAVAGQISDTSAWHHLARLYVLLPSA